MIKGIYSKASLAISSSRVSELTEAVLMFQTQKSHISLALLLLGSVATCTYLLSILKILILSLAFLQWYLWCVEIVILCKTIMSSAVLCTNGNIMLQTFKQFSFFWWKGLYVSLHDTCTEIAVRSTDFEKKKKNLIRYYFPT